MMKRFTLTLMAATAMLMPSWAQNRVKNVYTWHENLDTKLLLDKTQNVQLIRTLFAGYNSLCLPVSLSAEELQQSAKDVQIERLAAIRQDGDVLNLLFLDCTNEGLQAGMPYLIYSPTAQTMRAKRSDEVSMELHNVTLSDATGNNQVTFGSSWETLQVAGMYGIPASQDALVLESILIRTEGDKFFLPTRCGFTWDVQSPTATKLQIQHVTSLDADPTSIESLKNSSALVDVYDVQGQLVSSQSTVEKATQTLRPGIYVINGQKVAVQN